MSIQKTKGLVLGKFYPPHKGHQYLLSLAYHFVDELVVVVEEMPSEIIPASLRASWIGSMYPDADVVILSDFNPQHPNEHPDFWAIWKKSLKRVAPGKIDYVFAGEDYGKTLAKHLDADFIGSGGRDLHPVSGTQIRENPYKHWDMLTDPVKSYYRKTVCVCGPESTGKSTLSKNLASLFDQRFKGSNSLVPEYARGYLTGIDRDLCSNDFINIAKGQAASEAALQQHSGPLQIIDTGVNASAIWHKFLMEGSNPALDKFCARYEYDLYLLCSPDVPWVEDEIRYLPDKGEEFYQAMSSFFCNSGATLVEVRGDWVQRFNTAKRACRTLLS